MNSAASTDVLSVVTLKYSGSTIFALVVGMHPDVITLGEGQKIYWKAFRKARHSSAAGNDCSCGAAFAECPFWRGISDAVTEHVPPRISALNFPAFRMFGRDRLNRWAQELCLSAATRGRSGWLPPIVRGRYRDIAGANATLVDTARSLAGARVYMDTGKNPMAAALLASSPLRGARLIHLTRDGRGQIHSAMRHDSRLDFEAACRLWVDETRRTLDVVGHFGGRHETVRYEEFCADPLATARRVWTLCGLDPDAGVIDFERAPQHVMGNNAVRFGKTSTIRENRSWESELTADNLETFERIAGSLHRDLGYS